MRAAVVRVHGLSPSNGFKVRGAAMHVTASHHGCARDLQHRCQANCVPNFPLLTSLIINKRTITHNLCGMED